MRYLPYVLTLLTSSSLLFVVQPMVGKMIQPVLGGTPAVWNTVLVFFQALLLAGYLYAHLTTQWLGSRRQSLVHLVVMFAGLLFLPIAFEAPVDPTGMDSPTLWLLATLGVGVGWPFFVVSTTSPLLQKWFSTIEHRRAADPYHLYAASNVGSIAAVIAYPFVIEPHIGLQAQSLLWTVAYLVLCGAVALCAAIVWSSPARAPNSAADEQPPAADKPVSWSRRLRWLVWAFIPSSLMLAVTTRLATEIAPVPLLWLAPLALYLLSFVIVFARRQPIPLRWWQRLLGPAVATAVVLMLTGTTDPLGAVTIAYLAILFAGCMVFHGLLAADRPHARSLTEFYVWLSVGGIAGGIFNALVAPVVFDRVLETPLTLIVAALAVPLSVYRRRSMSWAIAVSTVAAAILLLIGAMTTTNFGHWSAIVAIAVGAVSMLFVIAKKPGWTGIAVALVVAIATTAEVASTSGSLHHERSFFGTHRVAQTAEENYHVLYHGPTIHGAQGRPDELRDIPLTYYYVDGPLGQTFDAFAQRDERHPVAAVGLGTGAIATYAQPSQRMDIFEIDPVVESIATDDAFFDYLDRCRGDCRVHIGDGRLLLEDADDGEYELIVLDAFSSSAIPLHLLTREAVEVYLRKLRPDGMVAIHVSSPHFRLEWPLAGIADDLGISGRINHHHVGEDDPLYDYFIESSEWIVLARSKDALGPIATDENWRPLSSPDGFVPWSDDYANIVDVIDW